MADFYRPVCWTAQYRGEPDIFMLQRPLKHGVTMQQAEAELTVIDQRLAKVYPRKLSEKESSS